ncbi:vWA domain-containing protein [Allosphingosinicella deserti]|nr:VWA domain-containing protein [Sphingomonas deserti]
MTQSRWLRLNDNSQGSAKPRHGSSAKKIAPRSCPLLASILLLSSCGKAPAERAEAAPSYPQQIVAKHAVSLDECFPEIGLADTQAPTGAEAGLENAYAIVAIDSSGSMAGNAGGQSKMAAARSAITGFVNSLPSTTPAGLIVFGHAGSNALQDKAASCSAGATLLVSPVPDRTQITRQVDTLSPAGWTPLAAAIETGADALGKLGDGPRILYVVSDGIETCGGDPAEAARNANGGAQRVVVNVIAFGVPTAEQAQLRSVAAAGGGEFLTADDASSLEDTLRKAAAARVRQFYLQTATTRAANVVATGGTISRATQCVKRKVAIEREAALGTIAQDEKSGRFPQPEVDAARAAINNRGSEALKILVAYSEAAAAKESNQADALWRRFQATRQAELSGR